MGMATYNLDPDVTRWGLHQLLDVCTISNSGSPGTITGYDVDLSQVEYVREGYCEQTSVESDEAVAQAYQEELSRLDSLEGSSPPNIEDEQLRASILAQDWHNSSRRIYDCGNSDRGDSVGMNDPEDFSMIGYENGMTNQVEIFGSSYEEGDIPVTTEDLLESLEISDESVLDGEVGRRLTLMVPVPHVPKTNEKIPSDEEEISDHQRLLDRLQLYDLVEHKVHGDGNCQFRSLSDQLYRTPDHHKFVREQIVSQLKAYPETYAGYVPMPYNDYLNRMNKSGEWGDHVTLQAAADWFGVKIFVITSFKDTCYIEILPQSQKSTRVICLSFWAEVHYNSIYPEGVANIIYEEKEEVVESDPAVTLALPLVHVPRIYPLSIPVQHPECHIHDQLATLFSSNKL